jgi:hypothetical protein
VHARQRGDDIFVRDRKHDRMERDEEATFAQVVLRSYMASQES